MINYIYFSVIPLFQYALDPFIIFCEHFKYWSSYSCIKSSLLPPSFPLNPPPSMNTFGKSGFYFTTELHGPDTGSQPRVLGKVPQPPERPRSSFYPGPPLSALLPWRNSSLFPLHLLSHPCLPPKPAYFFHWSSNTPPSSTNQSVMH